MLGKLIKYEWKSTYKICAALLLIMVVMTILGCASLFTPFWSAAFQNENIKKITPLDLMGLLTLFFYVMGIVGVMWGSLIYIGVHFYKSMYSDEGYLTHTLPVNSHQMLGCKILVNGLWYTAVLMLFMISLFCLCFSVMNVTYARSGGFWALPSNMLNYKDELVEVLVKLYGNHYILYLLMMLTGAFASIVMVFGAITIGQLSAKHKVMMSIVSYFAISIVSQLLSSILSIPFTMSNTLRMINDPGSVVRINYTSTYMLTMAVNIALSVILYFLSNYIITRKLNLD